MPEELRSLCIFLPTGRTFTVKEARVLMRGVSASRLAPEAKIGAPDVSPSGGVVAREAGEWEAGETIGLDIPPSGDVGIGEASGAFSMSSSMAVYAGVATGSIFAGEATKVGSGSLPRRAVSPPRRALEAKIGAEAAAALDAEGGWHAIPAKGWAGVEFRVRRDGSVIAVRGGAELACAPAPQVLGGNGAPPWEDVALGRIVLLQSDETLLFGTGPLGGVPRRRRALALEG